jgi:hypothetical protein
MAGFRASICHWADQISAVRKDEAFLMNISPLPASAMTAAGPSSAPRVTAPAHEAWLPRLPRDRHNRLSQIRYQEYNPPDLCQILDSILFFRLNGR